MKNLIMVIHILLTLLLIGCEKKGRDMYPGYVGEKKDGYRTVKGQILLKMKHILVNREMVYRMVKEQ